MKNTELLPTETQRINSAQNANTSDRLKDSLNDQTLTVCIQKHPGFMVCISEQCLNSNAFTCLESKCQCHQIHKMCEQKRITAIQVILENKQKRKESTKQYLSEAFQTINDKISDFSDQLIEKLNHQGQTDELGEYGGEDIALPTKDKPETKGKKQKSVEEITGSFIHKHFNANKVVQQVKSHQELTQLLTEKVEKFKTKELEKFINSISQLLLNQPIVIVPQPQKTQTQSQLCFDSQWIKFAHYKLINPTKIQYQLKNNTGYYRSISNFAIINPSLNQIYPRKELHTWKIKVLDNIPRINFYLGLKKLLHRPLDQLNNEHKNQMYQMFSTDSFDYRNNIFGRIESKTLKVGHQIQVKFSSLKSIISFIELRTQRFKSCPVSIFENQDPELHIFMAIGFEYGTVEIIPDTPPKKPEPLYEQSQTNFRQYQPNQID